MFSDRFHIFPKQIKFACTLVDCVAPARADKNFIDSSLNQVRFTLKKTGQIDSYSRNLTTINFSDVSLYLLLTFDGN